MGVPSPFIGAIQSPHLWTPHSGCQKTPQSLLLAFTEDALNISEKLGDDDEFQLGLPAVPLAQTPNLQAEAEPTEEAQRCRTSLPESPGNYVVKNTFIQLPGSSRDASPDLLPRRRSQSDWTGLRRDDLAVLWDLGGSIELAESLGGKYMPEWSLPPAACEEDYESAFSSPCATTSAAPAASPQGESFMWQYCWAMPDGAGGTLIVPCDPSDPALDHVVTTSATKTLKSDGNSSGEPSTAATSGDSEEEQEEQEDQKERRIDPDDDMACTFEELLERYSDRFTESQVNDYWECLDIVQKSTKTEETLPAAVERESSSDSGHTGSVDLENLPKDAAAGAHGVLALEAPHLLAVLEAQGFVGFYKKMMSTDDVEDQEALVLAELAGSSQKETPRVHVPEWNYGVCKASDPTTLELQNLPVGVKQAEIISLLDAEGFGGLYDFVFLPFNLRTGRNHPYAIVNVTDHSFGLALAAKLQGYSAWSVGSDAACNVEWSRAHQGLDAVLCKFRDHSSMHEDVPAAMRPMLFHGGEQVSMPVPSKRLRQPPFVSV